jgi:hypothetical protein
MSAVPLRWLGEAAPWLTGLEPPAPVAAVTSHAVDALPLPNARSVSEGQPAHARQPDWRRHLRDRYGPPQVDSNVAIRLPDK